MSHPVLELQAADTMADQLAYRRDHLPEREQMQAARNALIRWDQARTMMRKRLDELTGQIEQTEQASHGVDDHLKKLAAQMKTVIAPREAEALQHEMSTLHARRSELDDVELAALEEQSRIDDELSALLRDEPTLRDSLMSADAALSASEADIDGELTRIATRLDDLRANVDAPVLKRYDRLRKQFVVAAAHLAGSRCDGCHIDLSAHEVDEVKDEAAAGGVADCPQCSRILVV